MQSDAYFLYFAVVLIFTMFSQHPLILAVSYAGAVSYGILLNGAGKTLRQSFLFTLPALLIIALLNPMFNHYGVIHGSSLCAGVFAPAKGDP